MELGFKYAKNELGLKSMVYSKTSTLRHRHIELVSEHVLHAMDGFSILVVRIPRLYLIQRI